MSLRTRTRYEPISANLVILTHHKKDNTGLGHEGAIALITLLLMAYLRTGIIDGLCDCRRDNKSVQIFLFCHCLGLCLTW